MKLLTSNMESDLDYYFGKRMFSSLIKRLFTLRQIMSSIYQLKTRFPKSILTVCNRVQTVLLQEPQQPVNGFFQLG